MMKKIKDKFMKFLGYEKIENIKIPPDYKIPGKDKLICKTRFFNATGEFLDKVVINQYGQLLDGYTSLILAKAAGEEYVEVTMIKMIRTEYKEMILGYQKRNNKKGEKDERK